MPRIGCGLAGGTGGKIEPLISSALTSESISVTVYDFDSGYGKAALATDGYGVYIRVGGN